MDFEKALESVKTIKLTGGVFGKTSLVLVIMCICVTAITIKIGIWWFSLILALPMLGLVFYALKRVFDFADQNPQAAIMDGAELLVHEKIVHGMKDNEEIDLTATVDHRPGAFVEDFNREDAPPSKPSDDEGAGNG